MKTTEEQVLSFLQERPDNFNFKERTMFGKDMVLITPNDFGVIWTDDNSLFRSCLADKHTGKVYSLGFKKFTNLGEQPDFEPWEEDKPFEARHKVDGSLLCISKADGNLIVRTRGVFDAREHETGDEINLFLEKYPKLFDNPYVNSEEHTILCEHTTPNRIIVLREHDEPTLTLLGIINNERGIYLDSLTVDKLGEMWEVPRPKKYEYETLKECIEDVQAWEGKEGVVLYSWNGQILKKIKSDSYLHLHKIASGLNSIGNILDLYLNGPEEGMSYDDFYNYVELTLSYEIAEKIKDDMKLIAKAYENYKKKYDAVKKVVESADWMCRKEQALVYQDRWKDWRVSAAFSILDGKEIEKQRLKSILLQEIETIKTELK